MTQEAMLVYASTWKVEGRECSDSAIPFRVCSGGEGQHSKVHLTEAGSTACSHHSEASTVDLQRLSIQAIKYGPCSSGQIRVPCWGMPKGVEFQWYLVETGLGGIIVAIWHRHIDSLYLFFQGWGFTSVLHTYKASPPSLSHPESYPSY